MYTFENNRIYQKGKTTEIFTTENFKKYLNTEVELKIDSEQIHVILQRMTSIL